ncbi:HIT family protein [Halobiforma nitratireducens]|uniref:Histidine triad protein n=1 Tax=Halobiforma nitratireducens JCM 10879 TaxID=1227454 RepID=M0MBB5_9EURY|nr:HIT family protein [Halobiforma nitratireducens]EMA41934.1 histidine triad protein [Halobiforma nitratireducens JCM 10879]
MGDDGTDCEFCTIAAGDRPAHVLYETEGSIAFLDENPAVTGHTLVVPRGHETDLLSSMDSPGADVFRAVRIVAVALEDVLEPDGFSVFHTSGTLVGTVDHAHVHLLPRFEDDGISLALARERLREADAERLATAVRESVDGATGDET